MVGSGTAPTKRDVGASRANVVGAWGAGEGWPVGRRPCACAPERRPPPSCVATRLTHQPPPLLPDTVKGATAVAAVAGAQAPAAGGRARCSRGRRRPRHRRGRLRATVAASGVGRRRSRAPLRGRLLACGDAAARRGGRARPRSSRGSVVPTAAATSPSCTAPSPRRPGLPARASASPPPPRGVHQLIFFVSLFFYVPPFVFILLPTWLRVARPPRRQQPAVGTPWGPFARVGNVINQVTPHLYQASRCVLGIIG